MVRQYIIVGVCMVGVLLTSWAGQKEKKRKDLGYDPSD
jgi:hypothetical protein